MCPGIIYNIFSIFLEHQKMTRQLVTDPLTEKRETDHLMKREDEISQVKHRLKGTATLMISMFYQKELFEP